MNRIIFILTTIFIFSCQANDKQSNTENILIRNSVGSNNSTSNILPKTCKKCDKEIIETITEHYDKVTISQIEQFLCTLDKNCDLSEFYKKSGGTYGQIASDMLIVELDLHLTECISIIDKNKDIDFSYLLTLISKAPGRDLPYLSIIQKLERIKPRTSTEQKILNALKR